MKPRGVTLIEMFIVLAIIGTILAIVGSFFNQQRLLASRNAARNEVQDKVKMVMQLITQDLQLAGSRAVVGANTTINPLNNALTATNATATVSGVTYSKDQFVVRYYTTLRTSNLCREVKFGFNSASPQTIRRDDIAGSCSGSAPNSSAPTNPLADNILALDIVYVCGNVAATVVNSGSPPCSGNGYARTAKVAVVAQSNDPIPRYQDPNQYPTYSLSSGSLTRTVNLACPANRICYALEQEILMPNLRPVP